MCVSDYKSGAELDGVGDWGQRRGVLLSRRGRGVRPRHHQRRRDPDDRTPTNREQSGAEGGRRGQRSHQVPGQGHSQGTKSHLDVPRSPN